MNEPLPVEQRIAEMHREMRSLPSIIVLIVLAAMVAALPMLPGVGRLLGLELGESVPPMGLFVLVMLVAAAIFHKTGLSRGYWLAEYIESWGSVVAVLYLIYASGSAVSVFWAFYLVQGFVAASASPWGRRRERVTYIVCPLAMAAAFWILRDDMADAAITITLGACHLWIVEVLAKSAERVETLNQEKHRLAEEVASLRVSEERNRIARNLHDSLGATLTSMLWQARALESSVAAVARDAASETASEHLSQLRVRVSGSIEELRQVVTSMRAEPRTLRAFCEELEERCQGVARLDVRFEFDDLDSSTVLDGVLAAEALRATLEMVRNADRHAMASGILVTVAACERLRIAVADDGSGVPRSEVSRSEGGLANIKSRAKNLGVEFRHLPLEHGTQFEFDVPISHASAAS